MGDPEPCTADVMAHQRTDLAIARTVMGAERTLMAWIRTGLAMIGFGFTIYKVLQAAESSGVALTKHQHSPRIIGLFLLGLGSLSLLLGIFEFVETMKKVRVMHPLSIWRASLFIAIAIALLGVFLFFSVMARSALIE